MERLRAAIELARKSRAENGGTVPPQPPTTTAATVTEPTPEEKSVLAAEAVYDRWSDLAGLTLKPRRLRRHRLVHDATAVDQAPFDMLRTRLLTQIRKNGWRRVAVTSPDAACGKSTTCANLALAMSRQSDLRTLVFEADMRRPVLAKMFGLKGEKSFIDVLRGKAEFADQAVRIGANVALSVNYGTARDPAELLHRRRTSAVLQMIEEAYQPDLVIFDLPPILSSDDTLGFISNVDCALLVAMAEKTTAENIDLAESELAAHSNVAGIVLNRCRYVGGQYGYGYSER